MLGSLHNFLSKYQITDELTDKVIGYKNLNDIGTLLQDVMLRRTKTQVLKDLPKRMDKILFVPLTTQQLELHTEYADKVARLVNKWKRMHFLSEEDRQNLLKFLNMMRRASVDPQDSVPWSLVHLTPGTGYVGAAVVEGREAKVICQSWACGKLGP